MQFNCFTSHSFRVPFRTNIRATKNLTNFKMKVVLVFLAAVLAIYQAGEFKCPQPYLSQLKPIILDKALGVWYMIRTSPCEEYKDAECITHTIWKTKNTPANTVTSVCGIQTNGTWSFDEWHASFKSGAVDGFVEPSWEWTSGNFTVNSVFLESDNGQHWGIGHYCFEGKDGNLISLWAIVSRSKKMDPKLEQTLVERIGKHSGLTQDKFRGIRQTGCYELDHKDWV